MIVESWLARAAAKRPDRSAVEAGAQKLSYRELLAVAEAGAAALAQMGVGAGDSVALALAPGIDFAVALHSCWLTGAAAAPVDLRFSADERAAVTAGAAAVLEGPLVADIPAAASGRARPTGLGGETLAHDLNAVAVVIHTSGTTAAPKRVELTFGNLLWSALGSAVALGSDPQERWLSTLPVCHVGGLSILVRSAIAATTAVVHERYETQAALASLMERDITMLSVVATTLRRLLDAGLRDPPKLRVALAGGGPMPAPLLDRALAAGVPVCQTYGLTETCSQASTVPLAGLLGVSGEAEAGAGTTQDGGIHAAPDGQAVASLASLGAGRPLFCTQVEIAADGEILVRGPTVAKAAADPHGWLRTGDLGRLDGAGNLHVAGRKADTIISGGENVAPAEVEAVLEAHPVVAEAAVLARSDPQWGEAVTAIVVSRGECEPRERELIEQELIDHCAKRLAAYKVPKRIVLAAQPLPRTRSGKLLRRELA